MLYLKKSLFFLFVLIIHSISAQSNEGAEDSSYHYEEDSIAVIKIIKELEDYEYQEEEYQEDAGHRYTGRQVIGRVTYEADGAVIPYASVMEKGTTNGVLTDIDGYYVIFVDDEADSASLVVSYMGMENVEVLVDAERIDISMKSTSVAMDELVVTALGISREKKSLGYSSQALEKETLQEAHPTNALSSLSGRVAGLQVQGQNFGGSQNIMIRGASSFSGNNQPLFVVDGIPLSNESFNSAEMQAGSGGYDYGSMISDLNPNDIASIDVLKGSAASALYGARGQNGVVMITTQSGKSGTKTFSIDVSSGVTFENVKTLPELQNSYGGGYSSEFQTAVINGVTYDVVDYGADESWGPKFDASITPIHWWGMSDYEQGITSTPETAPWVASANDVASFYETGLTYQNSVNIVSTTEKSTIRMGYTNTNATGVMPNSEQKKNSYNLNASTSVLDDIIDLNTSMTLVNTATQGRPYYGSGNSPTQMFYQWGQRQLDMERLQDYMNAGGTQRAWNRTSVTDASPASSDNPYWSVYNSYQDDDRTRLYGKVGLVAHLSENLRAEGNVYFDTYTFNTRERVAIGSQDMSSYKEATRQGMESNYEGKLSYRKRVQDFDVMGMLGGNLRSNTNAMLSGETNGGLVIPDQWNLNNSTNQSVVDDYDSEKTVKSLFAMASVGWKNTLYVDGTYRIDYDSSLPSGRNDYDYFSISGSFIASELLDVEGIDMLKGRLNYGETGNGTSPYQVYNTFETTTPFNGVPTFVTSAQLNNANLIPEKTQEIELGLEAAFFDNRVGFDASLYDRTTMNQIVPMEVSGAGGYTYRMINAGTISNMGVELVLFATPIKVKDFKWDITLNYAKNKNRVEELPNGLSKIVIASANYSGAVLNATEGATFQELYGYDYSYDDDGNKIINPATGFYECGEFHSLGSVLPDYTAGLYNKFTYKDFDFGILFDTSQGGVYYSLSYAFGMFSGMQAATATPTSNGNTIREDGIVVDGVLVTRDANGVITSSTPNDINMDAHSYGNQHLHVLGGPSATAFFDASYIKLREITIGYTLPVITDYVKRIHVSAYGRNLGVWGLDNPGIDPETIVGGNGNIQGIEAGVTPGTQSYGFNVQLSF